ncbi:MAG: ADOP family duplicated permease [Acidobacteriota bacterium]
MKSWTDDLRFALRGFARSPGSAVVAVLTLGLGIGAVAAVASVVNAVLLAGLPYDDGDRLMVIEGIQRQADGSVKDWPLGYQDLQDLKAEISAFDRLVPHSGSRSYNLEQDGEVERVSGEMIGEGYLETLGQRPAAGRFFTAAEHAYPGPGLVTVLTYDFWRTRFGADEGILGSTLPLDGQRLTIVGVSPPGFTGTSDEAQLFLPVETAAIFHAPGFLEQRPLRWLGALGRLAPGTGVEAARAQMDAATAALEERFPAANANIGARVRPLEESFNGEYRRALWVLLAGALAVLLIAWTNVANLLIARTVARRHEIAIRAALGAGRRRLVRQLVTESALLALFGCALGLLVAHLGTDALVAASSVDFRSHVDPAVTGGVLLGITALSLVLGVLFGLLPGWTSARTQPSHALREGPRSGDAGRGAALRRGLVVAQVALALVLTVAAAMLAQGFSALRTADLGFEPREVLSLRLDLKAPRYQGLAAKAEVARQLAEELPSVPGVGELALVGAGVPSDPWSGFHFSIQQAAEAQPQEPVILPFLAVSPSYFQLLQIPVLQGRAFATTDAVGAPPVVVVSESLGRQLWGGEDPIGQRITFGYATPDSIWLEVVGIVADARHDGLRRTNLRPAPDLYLSTLQFPSATPPLLNVIARPQGALSSGGAGADTLAQPLIARIQELLPDLAPFDPKTLEQRLDEQVGIQRFLAFLIALFAVLALLLAALGLYGILSYSVARSRRELGVRLALGSGRQRVLSHVVGRSLKLAALGLAVGIVGVLVGGPWLQRVVEDAAPASPPLVAGTSAILLLVALLSGLLPAWRATRIDPVTVLREE